MESISVFLATYMSKVSLASGLRVKKTNKQTNKQKQQQQQNML